MSKIDHYFLDDKNFVLTIASGEIRDKEFIENVSYVRSSERLSDNYTGIVDCRGVTSFKTPTSDAIFSASKGVFQKNNDKNRRLAVLSDSKLVYGLARMYEFYSRNAEVEVFRDLTSAVKWLDLSCSFEEIKNLHESHEGLEVGLPF